MPTPRKCADCGRLFCNLSNPHASACAECNEKYWQMVKEDTYRDYVADRVADFNADMREIEQEEGLPRGSMGRDSTENYK